jgi:hypothetical protein
MMAAGQLRIRVLETGEQWFGLTYSEDRLTVENRIRSLVAKGEYPEFLWA